MAASAEASEADPNLTPLLDVVLQLIMFFMITINFIPTQHLSKDIKLPVAQTAVVYDSRGEYWVYMDIHAPEGNEKYGRVVAQEEEVNSDEKLKVFLLKSKDRMLSEARENMGKNYAPEKVRLTAVVSADGEARAADVWRVLNACDKAGFSRWKVRAFTQ